MRTRRSLLIAVCLILAFLLFVPLLLKTEFARKKIAGIIRDRALQQYGLRLEIQDFDFQWYPLILRSGPTTLYGGEGNRDIFLQCSALEVEIPYSSFFSDDFVVKRLVLAPAFHLDHIPTIKPQPKSKGTFRIREIEIRNGAAGYEAYQAKDVQMKGSVDPSGVYLDSLSATFRHAVVHLQGKVNWEPHLNYELHYEVSGDAKTVSELYPQAGSMAGKVRSVGSVKGEEAKYEVQGEIEADSISLDQSPAFQILAKYSYNERKVIGLDASWKGLSWQVVKKYVSGVPDIETSSSGTLKYEGTTDFWNGTGSFFVVLESPASLNGTASGRLADGRLFLEDARLSLHRTSAYLDGYLDASGLQLNVDASVPSAADLAILAPEMRSVPGSFQVEGTLFGRYEDLIFRGELQGAGLQASGTPVFGMAALHAAGEYHLASGIFRAAAQAKGIRAEKYELGDFDAQASGDGKKIGIHAEFPQLAVKIDASLAGKKYELQAQLEDTKLDPYAPVTGSITAMMQASGRIDRWRDSHATLNIYAAELHKEGIDLTVEPGSTLELAAQSVAVHVNARALDTPFTISGKAPIQTDRPMNLRLQSNGNLEILKQFTKDVQASGNFSLDAQFIGTLAQPQYKGTLQTQNFKLSSHGFQFDGETAEVRVVGKDISAQATGKLNGAATEMHAVVPLETGQGQLSLAVHSFPLSSVTSGAKGAADITVEADGKGMDPANWQGRASVLPIDVWIGETKVDAEGPLQITLSNHTVTLAPVRLRAADLLDVQASAQADLMKKTIAADVQTDVDLSVVKQFTSDVEAGGRLNGSFRAVGNWSDPVITGNLQLTQGALRISGYPFVLEAIQLDAPVTKDGLEVRQFNARMGGGAIRGGGRVDLQNWVPGKVDLWIKGTNIGTNYPEGLRSQIDADLKFAGAAKDYLLSGRISILHSGFRENLEPRSRFVRTLLSQKEALLPQESNAARIRLDLDIQTLEDLLIDNNLARARAAARIQALGSASQPRFSGRIQIRQESEVYFENPRETIALKVKRGNIDFTGKTATDVVFDIVAAAEIADNPENSLTGEKTATYLCNVSLTGSMQELNWDPGCVPTLDKQQFAALLATGNSKLQMTGASLFLGQQLGALLTGGFQQSVARTLGLQRFEIQPLLVASETDPGARLTLGKRFNPELELTYSLSLSRSTEQTWIADYRTRQDFGLRLIDKDDGTYSANLRHHLHFGRSTSLQGIQAGAQIPMVRITAIEITNDTEFPDEKIRKSLRISKGDPFDFWKTQEQIEALKTQLQKQGYLFPLVDLEEKDGTVSVRVEGRGKKSMNFEGIQVTDASKYLRWWREGFSEAAVLEQIQQDLLQHLWRDGFHKAAVEIQSDTSGFNFRVSAGKPYREGRLVIDGADHFQELESVLRPFYGSREEMFAEALHQFPRFKEKVQALYVEKGFLQTQVKSGVLQLDDQGGIAEKHVVISEGQQTRIASLTVSGGRQLPEDLLQRLNLTQGDVYRPLLLSEDSSEIRDYYQRNGYLQLNLETNVLRAGQNDVEVHYNLETGNQIRVASIRIVGNRITRRSLVESRIAFRVGDVLTPELLAATQEQLYRLRVFEQVSVRTQETAAPGQYDVTVEVGEIKNYELVYGARYDSEDHLEGEAQISDVNFLGMGQELSFYAKANAKLRFFQARYEIPSILGWNWNAFLIGADEFREFPLFDSTTRSLSFQQQYSLWNPLVLLTNYKFQIGKTKDRFPGGPINRDTRLVTSRLIGTLFGDWRDDPFNASRGRFFSFNVEYAPAFLGSDLTFLKTYTQYFHYQPAGRYLWISAARLGLASAFGKRLFASERFFAGGSNTLRGFQLDEAGPHSIVTGNPTGGEAVFVLNQELQYPLYRWFRGVVFFDTGNVWDKWRQFSLKDLRNSAGLGLRLTLPYGILGRIDLGINLDPKENEDRTVWHFGIGQAF